MNELIDIYKNKIEELKKEIEQCYKNKKGDTYILEEKIKVYENVIKDLEEKNI